MSLKQIAQVWLLVASAALGALAGEGPIALQTAEPSCPDDSGRVYVDCGNGTVTDNRTGLVWLKNADCRGEPMNWENAMRFAQGLSDIGGSFYDCGLEDGSSPGEWRLPTAAELEAMVEDANGDPGDLDCNPTITNDLRTGCWTELCVTIGICSFNHVRSAAYWSATTRVSDPAKAWRVNLNGGAASLSYKTAEIYVWPVRGGQ